MSSPLPLTQAAPPAPPVRPLWQVFMVFLGPMLLSNILQSLSGTLNSMFLGQMMGVKALAAVAAFFPVMFVFIAFVIGLGAAGQPDKVRAIAGTTLLTGLAMGAAVALFGGLFTQPIMRLLGTPADILEQATVYSRIVLLGMPGLFIFLLFTSLLRGVGDTLTPMWSLIVSNRALLRAMRPDWGLLRGVLRVGIPTGVLMIATSLAGLVVLSLINGFGSNATAAYGAVNQINAFAQFPLISVAITASILAAQSIGAGRSERLPAIARTAMQINLAIGGATALLGTLFARPLLSIFITDQEVLHVAVELLRIVLWSGLLFGAFASLAALMRASGDVLIPTLITIGVIATLELPLAWLFSRHFGLVGIWMAFPVSYGITLALQTWYYQAIWKKRPIRKMV